jgi:Transglycosylase SLT domain/SPOR domain
MRGFLTVLLVIASAAMLAERGPAQPSGASPAEEKRGADAPPAASAPPPDADAGRPNSDDAAAAPKPEPQAAAPMPEQQAGNAPVKVTGAMDSICLILESAAAANGLPLEFFARVIWQESRFQPNAVGPMTRRGYRAQGIAQFMPYTADERGLLDPFNPVAALPKAAEFLSELRSEFGNLGLAAAAYNAGPGRVRGFLGGRGGMPAETRNYVRAITGRSVDEWATLGREGGKDGIAKPTSCRQLAALLKEQPSFFIGELERHVREGALRPWGVQLSAGFSRARVLEAYARIERQYRALLENLDPMILRTVLRSRGTGGFYQVRVGADTRAAANKLCADLTAKGAACMVLRNSRGSPELVQRDGATAGPGAPGAAEGAGGVARNIPANAKATR